MSYEDVKPLLRLMKLIEEELAKRQEGDMGTVPPRLGDNNDIEVSICRMCGQFGGLLNNFGECQDCTVKRAFGMGSPPLGRQEIEQKQPIEHISKYTGLPYDPELIICPYGSPKPKRKFRLFRRREKPRPKQEHVSLFEVLPDGPYAGCERCCSFLEVLSEDQVEVFYEKERGHRHLFQSDPAYPREMDARLYYGKYDSETTRRINRIADNNGIKVVIRWDKRLISNDSR